MLVRPDASYDELGEKTPAAASERRAALNDSKEIGVIGVEELDRYFCARSSKLGLIPSFGEAGTEIGFYGVGMGTVVSQCIAKPICQGCEVPGEQQLGRFGA